MHDEKEMIALFKEAAWQVDQREFEELSLDTHISDLGIDSVAMLEIFGYVEEELDLHLPDEKLSGIETLGDLSRLIRSAA